jgi:hypothetical protein
MSKKSKKPVKPITVEGMTSANPDNPRMKPKLVRGTCYTLEVPELNYIQFSITTPDGENHLVDHETLRIVDEDDFADLEPADGCFAAPPGWNPDEPATKVKARKKPAKASKKPATKKAKASKPKPKARK